MPVSREAIELQMRRRFPKADLRWSDQGHIVVAGPQRPFVLKSKGKHNHKGLGMKHKLTTVACVLAIAAASFVTVQGYHRYKTWASAQAAKAASYSAEMAHQNALRQANFNAQVKKLEDQCTKDKAAYDALPLAQKAKTPAPQCSVNLVQ